MFTETELYRQPQVEYSQIQAIIRALKEIDAVRRKIRSKWNNKSQRILGIRFVCLYSSACIVLSNRWYVRWLRSDPPDFNVASKTPVLPSVGPRISQNPTKYVCMYVFFGSTNKRNANGSARWIVFLVRTDRFDTLSSRLRAHASS